MRVLPFTSQRRGGAGEPLVLLHGFMETWRSWELMLPALERRHDVLAPTLAGHAGGPPLGAGEPIDEVVAAVERAMDEAGFATAHTAGNSLGGWLALKLAERGRARSVVALAPAGGWAADDPARGEILATNRRVHHQLKALAPRADRLLATPAGRAQAMHALTTRTEHIPRELIAHLLAGVAAAPEVDPMLEGAQRTGWPVDAERITCPVRVVWGTADELLPWPSAAARYRSEWLPHADWVVLDDVGHAPQLDVPLEAAELIAGFSPARAG